MNKRILTKLGLSFTLFLIAFTNTCNVLNAQTGNHSIARTWIEQVLFSVRNDFARPPVHSRNLFHVSAAMHDAWAAYEDGAEFYFLGQEVQGFQSNFYGVPLELDSAVRISKQNEAISFAAYRIIRHRFLNAPGAFFIYERADSIMLANNYDITNLSTNYIQNGPAEVGNYIAEQIIQYGLQDGSNEIGNYQYQSYSPANPPIAVEQPGNPTMIEPNRWQPITLTNPVDQSGNPIPSTPLHLGPEWGDVKPFSLSPTDLSFHIRDAHTYQVYHNPGDPPYLDTTATTEMEDFFKWNFVLVSMWQSHLDPSDNTMWDISPNSVGNIQNYPQTWAEYDSFYDLYNGGDPGIGYAINPSTGLPYVPQMVKRADYARVLAEFWADGLDSETPPGHWFNIYNEVSDHIDFERKWKGIGPDLGALEYDVKAYLTMGGAMHDAAISSWSIKGWYDYPRAVSTLRYMAGKGQSSNSMLTNFHPAGLPLVPGYVEVVQTGDPLAGLADENVDKIKLFTWRGPDYISDPLTDHAGVGWILAENWWPYQRPSFVSPPFAGYVSGHSTFSSAAAEVMTFITGSPYFPGGMSGFVAEMNNFLAFEQGPSQIVVLQWAKYKDASDQCSLSRIWGGIHPPVDDIAGRFIGEDVGQEATVLADQIVVQEQPIVTSVTSNYSVINSSLIGQNLALTFVFDSIMATNVDPKITFLINNPVGTAINYNGGTWLSSMEYEALYSIDGGNIEMNNIYIHIDSAVSAFGTFQKPCVSVPVFVYDTKSPILDSLDVNYYVVNSTHSGSQLIIDLFFSEDCDLSNPIIDFSPTLPLAYDFAFSGSSAWISPDHYRGIFDISLLDPMTEYVAFSISNVTDNNGNLFVDGGSIDSVFIDTELPLIINAVANEINLNVYDLGSLAYSIDLTFNKSMNTTSLPEIVFVNNGLQVAPLDVSLVSSQWNSPTSLSLAYNLPLTSQVELYNLELFIDYNEDVSGNPLTNELLNLDLAIDTKRPEVYIVIPSESMIGLANFVSQDFYIDVVFDETMNNAVKPIAEIQNSGIPLGAIAYYPFASSWLNDQVFRAKFTLPNLAVNEINLSISLALGQDSMLNPQIAFVSGGVFDINYDPIQLGISELEKGEVYVYPNPIAKGQEIRLKNTGSFEFESYTIIDQMGRVIEAGEIFDSSNDFAISNLDVSQGMYIIRLKGQNNVVDLRIVVNE